MRHSLKLAAVVVIVAAGSFELRPALAQEGAGALEEIIITARRREESLQDTPVSVSAFGADDIVKRGLRSVEDIARFSPGLSLAKAFGRSTDRPVIRGQGNVLAGVQFGVESGAAYFVDGVYYPGDLSSLDLSSLQRVEVIRGPQAALYGRNTYSGAINFITASPGDEFDMTARLRYGQDADQEAVISVSGPLTEALSGSLTGRYYSFDGEWDNITTGGTVGDEETISVFGRLDFTPNDNLTLSARVNYQEDDDGTRPFFLQPSESNNCFPGTRSNAAWLWTGSSNNNQYYCGEINAPGDTVQLNDGPVVNTVLVPGIPNQALPGWQFPPIGVNIPAGGQPYNTNTGVAFSGVQRDLTFITLQGEYEFDNGYTLVGSVAGRSEDRKTGSDSDHTSVNLLPAPGAECAFCASGQAEDDDYSVEIKLRSPADQRLRWLLGAFYYDQEQSIADITFTGVDPVDEEATVENMAVFGSIEYDFTEQLSATLEVRWFDEEKGLTEDVDTATPVTLTNSFDEIAPRLSVNYRPNDDTLVYGIYAKGFKPGGVIGSAGAALIPPTTTYDQEESDTFELGLKRTAFDGRVTVNAAVFFIDAENIQLTTPLSSTASATLTSVVTNQGGGETFGIELDARWAATENLLLGATYALADTEFTEGCDDFQWTLTSGGGVLQDAEACTGNNVNGSGNGSIVGNQFPLSSEHQFSAFADYRTPSFGDTEFFANLSYSWEDEKPVQVHNQAWVPAASIVDLRLGWQTESWEIALYGRNLTDEDAPNMVTRWLQDPLVISNVGGFFSSGRSETNAGAPAGACNSQAGLPCSTTFPRAFFGDLRRGRNFGVEATFRFGGN
ncbi:MAG: TonB-dependent receptor [Pseudomonadota bacterium]